MNTLWLFWKFKTIRTCSKSKAMFFNMQSTYLLKANTNHNRQNKPSEITTILFVNFSRRLTSWVWAFGGHDSPPYSQFHTNQIWTQICILTVFCFATGCWPVYNRNFSRELWKENAHMYICREHDHLNNGRKTEKSPKHQQMLMNIYTNQLASRVKFVCACRWHR